MHGQGTFTWKNGNVYNGNWERDLMNGHGKYTYANGNIYEGQWLNGKKHGQGKMTYISGEKNSGKGTVSIKVKEGEWKDDEFIG